MMRWLDSLFTTDAMRRVLSDRGRLQGMLYFEAALARAQARAGLVPGAAVGPIESQCRAELYDLEELARATALAGNTAIPVVKALTERVARSDADASRWVHWGATSQDAMDTGLMLQLRDAAALLDADLARVADALARLALAHKRTLMAGRTLLLQAQPITFGLKAAAWLDAVERDRARLREWRARGLAVQLGGAVGTLAALGPSGMSIAAALAEELGLACPVLPWHAQRDRVAEAATTLGLLVGTLGKIARDLALMMQTEVGEAFEPDQPGRGGSSSLPHKRNPVGCATVLAAAARVPALVSIMLSAMVQEHERGLGDWHAEWDTLPEICALAGGATAQLAHVLEHLEVDAGRMRRNLDATGGQIYAGTVAASLAPHVGALPAQRLVADGCRRAVAEGRHLRDVLRDVAEVRAHVPDLDRLFDPAHAIGLAEAEVDRVLANRSR
ncbi:MAG TPA: 3-carboxy-cis,cis-muconate cycloisomerase [Haliangiales bacterium]|nr:3-carboxy-cis,cis-muconate cycloisomerase [Haliangiales bacterium]